ncbi:MAG TPA: PIN domain-containing protein [Planctomycetota bacterium]|nr:PIN domain-containing protein [Planctomycetota bacterium]
MRVFLDTNVLAAALGTRGLCRDVLAEVLEHHLLLCCADVETELDRALRRKFGVPAATAREAVDLLRRSSKRVRSRPRWPVPLPDPADAAIVSAAINGKAEVFVTGDGEIQALGAHRGVEVLSPRAFWERVQRRGGGG